MKRKVKNIIVMLSVLVISLMGVAHGNAFDVDETEMEYTVNIFFCQHTIRGIHYQAVPDTGKPLLVLVHGATYGKWMWNVPGYSWVDHFVAGLGYPVLAIDRLGYGDSSHPNGDLLPPRIQVHTLKQLLYRVRQSTHGQRPIIWAGHSMGALFGNMIAGESDLLDGLITIGWEHGQQSMVGDSLTELLELIEDDYITYTDEMRTESFYYIEGADLGTIVYDNLRAEPMPRGSLWAFTYPDQWVLGLIDIPVLLAAGQYDALWENIDLEAETDLFTNASVTTFLQEDAGHTNLLHLSHESLLDAVHGWLETYF